MDLNMSLILFVKSILPTVPTITYETIWTYITIASVLTTIFWNVRNGLNYWKDRSIGGFNASNMLYYAGKVIFTPFPLLNIHMIKVYGKIHGFFFEGKPALMIAEPHLIKKCLVEGTNVFLNRPHLLPEHPIMKDNLFHSRGEVWRRLRPIITPTFSSGKIKRYYPMIRECLEDLFDYVDPIATIGDDIKLKYLFGNFAMAVVSKCAFATKTNTHADPRHPFIKNAKRFLEPDLKRTFLTQTVPHPLLKQFGIQSAINEPAMEFFIKMTAQLVEERRKNVSEKYDDFIQLLMDAESNEVDEYSTEKKRVKRLSYEEILAQGLLFFIAGYDTTASTISFCAYQLAMHPHIQERLHREVVGAVDANGELDIDTLNGLKYLDAVLCETLRITPPVSVLQRELAQDGEVGDSGIKMYKDQNIMVPVHAMHHLEEYYPNPKQFKPERFMPGNKEQIQPYTYLPFGTGPRMCIGMRFSTVEAKLCLAHVVRRFRLTRSIQTQVPQTFNQATAATEPGNLYIRFEKR